MRPGAVEHLVDEAISLLRGVLQVGGHPEGRAAGLLDQGDRSRRWCRAAPR